MIFAWWHSVCYRGRLDQTPHCQSVWRNANFFTLGPEKPGYWAISIHASPFLRTRASYVYCQQNYRIRFYNNLSTWLQ